MSRIFISYRRDDAAGHARGLYDRLVRHFGRDQVFMDLGIKPSQDFTRQINAALARCDVLLAVIGREWSRARDEHGRRRLDDPEDWLLLEIATALRREDVAIFPVLVQDAPMPRADELPDDLKGLTRLQAHELADGHGWDGDVDFLADAMRRRIGAATAVPALVHALGAAALLLVPAFAAAEAVKVWDRPDPASVEALVRLGAVHAAAWALLVLMIEHVVMSWWYGGF